MFDKMKELMEMKRQADQIKRELDAVIVDSDEGRGIKVKINGSQGFQSIEIEERLLGPENKKRLETEVLRSVNAAVRKSQNVAAQKMKSLMPGFPGM
jgi:DNA-binding YbaB/EbfC family protein